MANAVVKLRTHRRRNPLPTGKGIRYGGRQKGSRNQRSIDFREACRGYGPEVVARMVGWMREGDHDPDLAFRAASFLAEHGWGKPAQAMMVATPPGNPLDLAKLDDVQLGVLIERLEAAAGEDATDKASPLIEGEAKVVE
jgi:hypothetical protein